ncbi:unnamed protein product [Dibothriocephalus latus]|uniref:Uncharacterized protein n=1 Tax=Dibothriocephalus latus TaxID=60516 RepID=A0A3P7PLR0_DIBLA|nr:unnamed protein product [Dibothriocephalus latus]
MHVAAFVGSSDIVRMLLERGASVDQTTMRCETALHLAARNCQLNVAGVLLSAHATVDAKAKVKKTEEEELYLAAECLLAEIASWW